MPRSWMLAIPHLQLYGGIFRLLYLARELKNLNQDVVVAVGSERHASSVLRKFIEENQLNTGTVRAVRKKQVDVVLTGDASTSLGRNLRKFSADRYVFLQLAGGEPYRSEHRTIERKASPDFTISVSSSIQQDNVARSILVPGGVDLSIFREKVRTIQSEDKLVLATHYGRGKPFKGFLTAIEVVEGLRAVGLEAELAVFSSVDVPDLEKSWIHKYVGLPKPELAKLFDSVGGVLSFERRPGWGNVAAEAASAGTFVLGNGVNGEDFLSKVDRKFVGDPASRCFIPELAGFIEHTRLNRDLLSPPDLTDFSWPVWSQRIVEVITAS